jgi:hypothetical protein
MSLDCLVALIALVLQFGLGMVLNLFITVPPGDARAGFITEVRTAPLGLTLHALLGTLLIGAAIVLVTRAVRAKDRLVIAFAATGLAAVAGAFTAGEMFVRDGRDGVSLAMALLTGVALVSYASALARVAGTRQGPTGISSAMAATTSASPNAACAAAHPGPLEITQPSPEAAPLK